MTMTRKDYEAIAGDLRKFASPNMTGISYKELCRQISLTMKADNARHDTDRFLKACTP